MKEVIFVRHAKSDWGNETLKDVDRHLSERGYNDAYFLSEWFAKNHKSPELIISSTATRAISTALIFARELTFNAKNVVLSEKIFDANTDDILSVIRDLDNSKSRLMLFGHNPGFTNICNELSEEMFFDNVPTCGIVSITFATDNWHGVTQEHGKLHYYKFPKDFKDHN